MSQQLAYPADQCSETLDGFDMTFQVLLFGSDGLVLASDRLLRTRGLREMTERRRPSYQPTLGTKIHVSDDKLTVCSFAGAPYSETIARRIVTRCCPTGLSEPSWRNSLEAATKEITEYSEQISDELFVIRTDNMTALKLIRQQKDDPTFTPIDGGSMYAGLETDAILLPKLFWRDGLKCEELRPLAVASIAQASIEAPHLIGGGIDIVEVKGNRHIETQQYSQTQANDMRDLLISKVWDGLRN